MMKTRMTSTVVRQMGLCVVLAAFAQGLRYRPSEGTLVSDQSTMEESQTGYVPRRSRTDNSQDDEETIPNPASLDRNDQPINHSPGRQRENPSRQLIGSSSNRQFEDPPPSRQMGDSSSNFRWGNPSAFRHSSGRHSTNPSASKQSRNPSSGRQSTNPSASRQSRNPSSGRQSTNPSAGRQSRNPSSGRQSTNPLASRQSRNPSSGRQSTNPSASRQSGNPSSGRQSTNPSARTESRNPSSGRQSTNPSASRQPGNPSSGRQSTNPSASRQSESRNPSSGRQSTNPSASRQPGNPSSGRQSTNPSASRQSENPSFGRQSTNPSASSQSGNPSSGRQSTNPSASRQSGNPSFGRQSSSDSFTNKAYPSPYQHAPLEEHGSVALHKEYSFHPDEYSYPHDEHHDPNTHYTHPPYWAQPRYVQRNAIPESCSCNCDNYGTEHHQEVSEPNCEWRMVFKAVQGNQRSVYDDWLVVGGINDDVEEAKDLLNELPYKDGYVIDNWNFVYIKRVKIEVFSQGVLGARFYFDATASDLESWFSPRRLISSPAPDLKSRDLEFFSIDGDATRNVRFFIDTGEEDCSAACGYLAVIDPSFYRKCDWEYFEEPPFFLWSAGESCKTWQQRDTAVMGDRFVISVKICDREL